MASKHVSETYEEYKHNNFDYNNLGILAEFGRFNVQAFYKRRLRITNKDHIFVYARKYIALVYKHLCSPHAVIYLSRKSLADVYELYCCYHDSNGNPSLRTNGRIKHRYLRSLWFSNHEAIKVVETDGSEFVDISHPKRSAFCRVCSASLLFLRRCIYRFLHYPKV